MKSSIGLFYQITVTDKNGKVIRKTRQRRSRSFCIAFLKLLEAHFIQDNVMNTEIGGNPQLTGQHATNFSILSGTDVVTHGIVVGTGTTAPANDDYCMETLIADGNGAGQLEYAATSVIAAQEVGANVDVQILRSMQNLSGGTINITEAGIQVLAVTSEHFLIIRDTFTAVPVADGQTITVTYTLRTTA